MSAWQSCVRTLSAKPCAVSLEATSLSAMQRITPSRQVGGVGVRGNMLTGGEPLVRKRDVVRLAEKHDDCLFNVFTNASLVDQAFCDDVKRVGNIIFSVSLESYEAGVNDGRRGNGSFDEVMGTGSTAGVPTVPDAVLAVWCSSSIPSEGSYVIVRLIDGVGTDATRASGSGMVSSTGHPPGTSASVGSGDRSSAGPCSFVTSST